MKHAEAKIRPQFQLILYRLEQYATGIDTGIEFSGISAALTDCRSDGRRTITITNTAHKF